MELADNEENEIRPSPSPRPSPLGRGRIVCPHLELARTLWLVRRRTARFPLPKGEGQPARHSLGDGGGEGEQDVSQPDAPNAPGFKDSKRKICFPETLPMKRRSLLRRA